MRREPHVRFCERAAVRFLRATHPGWLDPRVRAVGVQVGQAVGWRRLVTVAVVGVLAVGLAKEWAAHASRDTPSPQ